MFQWDDEKAFLTCKIAAGPPPSCQTLKRKESADFTERNLRLTAPRMARLGGRDGVTTATQRSNAG